MTRGGWHRLAADTCPVFCADLLYKFCSDCCSAVFGLAISIGHSHNGRFAANKMGWLSRSRRLDVVRVQLPACAGLGQRLTYCANESMSIVTAQYRNCPHCHSERVNWSRSKGYERVARFVGVGYYRCRACSRRFVAFRWWGHNQLKVILGALAFLAFIVVFWQIINFVSRFAEQ
jgi:DNA-directed RNA polymerase subunit RPC12/RpoP